MSKGKMDTSWMGDGVSTPQNRMCEDDSCGKTAKYRYRLHESEDQRYSNIKHLCKGHIAAKYGIDMVRMPDSNSEDGGSPKDSGPKDAFGSLY